MAVVDMVQPVADQIIDMVAVRHRFMAAAGAVDVRARAAAGAAGRIGVADRHHMCVDMVAMLVMKMAVVKIVEMAVVVDRGMATAGAVDMVMIGVGGVTFAHGGAPRAGIGRGSIMHPAAATSI